MLQIINRRLICCTAWSQNPTMSPGRAKRNANWAMCIIDAENISWPKARLNARTKCIMCPKRCFTWGDAPSNAGRDLAAIVRFVEFARLFPDLPDADEALWQAGMAYERRGRHRDARALFLELAKSHPTSAYADRAAWRAGVRAVSDPAIRSGGQGLFARGAPGI